MTRLRAVPNPPVEPPIDMRAMPDGPRSHPADRTTLRCSDASRIDRYRGPSERFLNLTRNTALESPVRFERTIKSEGDIEL